MTKTATRATPNTEATTAVPKTRRPYYMVTQDGTVYRAATKKAAIYAADVCGGYEVTEDEIDDLPTAVMVLMYNRARPERPITKFRDRAAAGKALAGVMDFLGVPMPSHLLQTTKAVAAADTITTTPEHSIMTEDTKKRGPKAKPLPQDLVDRTIELRRANATWAQILTDLSVGASFIHRVRKQLKELDPTLVKPLGPGSPTYGVAKQQRVEKVSAAPTALQEAF
jgi:hypothetical protein